MPAPYVDPDGNFAVEAGPRVVELWATEPIRFERRERPAWQQRAGGAVARLQAGLRAMEPREQDVLAAAFSHPDSTDRPDVENRLFTNTLESAVGAPTRMQNPFAGLPRRILFERRFAQVEPPEPLKGPPVHYRYSLEPTGVSHRSWRTNDCLAEWRDIQVSNISEGSGAPIWLAMRAHEAHVRPTYHGTPIATDLGVELTLHACREVQAVTVMEALIDGVIASFQRESDLARAERVADALRRRRRFSGHPRAGLIKAQTDPPAILAGAPWSINDGGTWVQLAPADHWVVAGEFYVSRESGRASHALSGSLHRACAPPD